MKVWQSGGGYLGCWQELSEQAVRDIFETEERLGTEQRALERGGDFSGGDSLELRL